MKSLLSIRIAIVASAWLLAQVAHAQTTQFTYQGVLKTNGIPVTGIYDFRATFYGSPTGSDSLGQTYPMIGTNVDNGLFILPIDLGTSLWLGCSNRWLEIEVRPTGPEYLWHPLSPRTLVTPTPYAMAAYTACNVEDNAITGASIGAGQVVKSFNGLKDSVTLFAGANVTLTPSGNNIEIATTGSGDTSWQLNGNSGTAAGVSFLGTSDNQPLEIKVNNLRALRIEPTGGSPSFSGGYSQNYANGPGGVVAGGGTSGSINEAAGMYAFVGAGHGSKAGPFSAVVGGAYNVALSQFSFIGAGLANTNTGIGSAIVGGTNNLIEAGAENSAIGGGAYNVIDSDAGTSSIAGGAHNRIQSYNSTVGGGVGNSILRTAFYSTISGGSGNSIQSLTSTIGGGSDNAIQNSTGSTVGGGTANAIQTNGLSTIGGGQYNTIRLGSSLSTIGGGDANSIGVLAQGSTISGGSRNAVQANATFATIAGGKQNFIGTNSEAATIAGGLVNTIEAGAGSASIAGGNGNWIQGGAGYTAIGGGYYNTVESNAIVATIGGGAYNTVQSDANFATISGGVGNFIQTNGYNAVISGGHGNTNQSAAHSTIGGGGYNLIQHDAYDSTIGGGGYNTIQAGANSAAIGGGHGNTAIGIAATVPGGNYNLASGVASLAAGSYSTASGSFAVAIGDGVLASGYAAIALGSFTEATNEFTMAVGKRAKARHPGSFVWADSEDADFASIAGNQFNIRAANGLRISDGSNGNVVVQTLGGFGTGFQSINFNGYYDGAEERFNTNKSRWRLLVDQRGVDDTMRVDVFDGAAVSTLITVLTNGNVGIGNSSPGNRLVVGSAGSPAYCNGTTWVNGSDRNSKQDFVPVNATDLLAKVVSLPLQSWSYKVQPDDKHIGPVAQDFHAAFGLNGSDDKHIATVDADGVALAAIQGLNEKVEARSQSSEVRIQKLEVENENLKRSLNHLNEIVQILNQKLNGGLK